MAVDGELRKGERRAGVARRLSEKLRVVGSRLVLATIVVGCGSASEEPKAPEPKRAVGVSRERARGTDANLTLLGRIEEGTWGPHRFRGRDVDCAIWAVAAGEGSGVYRRDLREGLRTERLSDVPAGLRFSSGHLDERGTLSLAFVHGSDRTNFLSVARLAKDSTTLSPRQLVVETPSPILWAKTVDVAGKALVLWAERGAAGADLYARSFDDASLGEVRRVVRGAVSWQFDRAWGRLLLVTAEGKKDDRALVARFLDGEGTTTGAPKTLVGRLSILDELDFVVGRDRVLVAVSERRVHGTRLATLVLGSDLNVLSPLAPMTKPRGTQLLERLLVDESRENWAAVWEEPGREEGTHRHSLLALLDSSGRPRSSFARLSVPAGGFRPELALGGDGSVSFLFAGNPKSGVHGVVFGRGYFDGRNAEASEWFVTDRPLGLGWDLGFSGGEVSGLVATAESSPLVYGFRGPGSVAAPAPWEVEAIEALPRVVSEEIVATLPELSTLRARAVTGGVLASWLSYFDPSVPETMKEPRAPDGRPAPMRAWVKSQFLATRGEELALSEEAVISYRARSLGGLGVVPVGTRFLYGWAAIDGREPGLFLTLVDAVGRKVEQKMVAKSSGEITDIAVLALPSGFLVAWVDARGSSPDLYALRVDDKLRPIGQEIRLSDGLVDPTGVTLVRLGGRALLAYVDHRQDESASDLFLLPLVAETGQPASLARRLFPSPEHTFSPLLVPAEPGEGALLAWLEAGEPGSARGRLLAVELDGEGRPVASPAALPIAGEVRSFDARRSGTRTEVVFTVAREGRGELWGALVGDAHPPRLLTTLEGPPSQTVAPALAGSYVLVADRKGGGPTNLRALALEFE